ncbi:MAG: proton-conducting transporter membrane subunit [Pseudomonadota bacterium]
MNAFDQLLLLAAGTVLVTLLTGGQRWSGWLATLLYAGMLALLFVMAAVGYDGVTLASTLAVKVPGFVLHWEMTPLSWFFALLTVGAGLLCSWYAAGEWGARYGEQRSLRLLQTTLALNVASMLLLVTSADLLGLFIGWELMSWASLLLMIQNGPAAVRAAMRYLPYAMAGAMALLGAIALLYVHGGTLALDGLGARLADMGTLAQWTLLLLLFAGFGVKMAAVPFHLWQPQAYSEAPGAGAAFLGSISSRMGLFAMALVLVRLIGFERLAGVGGPSAWITPQDVMLFISAATILVGAYVALRQDDARLLLAWSGISQGGYMMLGLFSGAPLAVAGGLSHLFSYATYEAGLFLTVFAVMHRTGTADLNKLGGLVTRMPLSFLVLLMGIIGLAGLPPINGFVSKWMIYRGLLDARMVFSFMIAVLGTLGSVLYCYKLIHNIFLGQLRLEHETVREAPWSMTLPMLVLGGLMFATGYMPGIVLDWVAPVMGYLGLQAPAYSLGAIHTAGADLDMLWLVTFMLAGFGVGAVIFYSAGRAQRVHQLDNYAGGHFLTADTRYQYSYNFYPALYRLIGPLYRDSFQWLESAVLSLLNFVSAGAQGIYRSVHPALYLLAVVVLVSLAWGVV